MRKNHHCIASVLLLWLVAKIYHGHAFQLARSDCDADGVSYVIASFNNTLTIEVAVSYECCTSTASVANHLDVIAVSALDICQNDPTGAGGMYTDPYVNCNPELTVCTLDANDVPCFQEFFAALEGGIDHAVVRYDADCVFPVEDERGSYLLQLFNDLIVAGSQCTQEELFRMSNQYRVKECEILMDTLVYNNTATTTAPTTTTPTAAPSSPRRTTAPPSIRVASTNTPTTSQKPKSSLTMESDKDSSNSSTLVAILGVVGALLVLALIGLGIGYWRVHTKETQQPTQHWAPGPNVKDSVPNYPPQQPPQTDSNHHDNVRTTGQTPAAVPSARLATPSSPPSSVAGLPQQQQPHRSAAWAMMQQYDAQNQTTTPDLESVATASATVATTSGATTDMTTEYAMKEGILSPQEFERRYPAEVVAVPAGGASAAVGQQKD